MAWGFDMTHRLTVHSVTLGIAAFAVTAMLAASPARADRCDDLAKHLAGQIDGLKIGETRGGVIYLTHPAATRATLGCSSRNRQNDFYAFTTAKKPSDAFVEFAATAAALIFTIPKNDASRGSRRCLKRIGLLRGSNIATRYRKLDILCNRTKAGTSLTISREKGQ
jgi:hypothetical protein